MFRAIGSLNKTNIDLFWRLWTSGWVTQYQQCLTSLRVNSTWFYLKNLCLRELKFCKTFMVLSELMSVGESIALLRQEVWFLFIEFKKCCDTSFSLILCIYANSFTSKTIFSKTYSNFWCTLSRWLTSRNSQLLSQISWLIDAYFRVLEVTIPLSRRGHFFNLRKPVFSGLWKWEGACGHYSNHCAKNEVFH